MSEDTNASVDTGSTPVDNTPQFTDVEQRAMELGWVPKDDYSGDPQRWKSAEVFLALDEPIKRIESQSKELKAVRKALEAMQEHYSKVKETEYTRALETLKAEKKKALVDGDLEKYDQLTDEIETVKETARTIKQTAPVTIEPEQVNPEFRSWVNRNPWYESYKHMAAFADEVGLKLHNQGVSKAEILKRVEEEVRKEFPTKFRNANKDNAPAVEGSTAKRSTGTKASGDFELTEQERNIMNTLVRSGAITKDKYIADLRKVKGLE